MQKREATNPYGIGNHFPPARLPNPFKDALPAEPTTSLNEDGEEVIEESEKRKFEEDLKTHQKKTTLLKALRSNEDANPVKPPERLTVSEAIQRYIDEYSPFVKPLTSKGIKYALRAVLNPLAEEAMMGFKPIPIIDSILTRVTEGTIKARTGHDYAVAIKQICEWFYKATNRKYSLPEEWKELFLKKRFKNKKTDDELLNEDGEEMDFLPYSNDDLKTLLDATKTDRQRLYILLSLNCGMYFVDIAYALKKKNVYLNRKHPFLLYKREKETHHLNPVVCKCWLWPETVSLLKSELNPGDKHPYALLDENGKPMDKNAPEMAWKRVKTTLKDSGKLIHRKVRFTDLRKTGASAIANIASADLAELYLGHKISGVGSRYIKLQKRRLYKPLMRWREQLVQEKVL